jgi:hypothetical protein
VLKPASEIVTVEVPPLIDQATFDAVQAQGSLSQCGAHAACYVGEEINCGC